MPTALERRPDSPFSLPSANPWMNKALGLAANALGLAELDRLYRLSLEVDAEDWLSAALAVMEVQVKVEEGALDRVPSAGSLLVVANHPFGGLEGVALLHLLRQRRPDVKILANQILMRIPELRGLVLPVDVFGGPQAQATNLRGLRLALQHLRQGGLLACFPSGEVSSLNLAKGGVVDPAWNPQMLRLAQKSGAAALPMRFDGGNSPLFQAAGLLHPRLRTALLGKEMLGKRHSILKVAVGEVVPHRRFAGLDAGEATLLLRSRCELLQGRFSTAPIALRPPLPWLRRPEPEALALAQHPWVLQQEVASLPPGQLLSEGGGLQCWVAEASQIPQMLEEIGVQRERCFRAAGEGTGKAMDLDRFDAWYLHLFLWNPERRELAGAYRMGLTDQVLQAHGPSGLYTTTLFRLNSALLQRLSPGLEMGRSFVREGYQGTHGPLMLLWRGIGRFLSQRPQYRHLFGAVSISVLYRPLSRALMADFCRQHLRLEGQGPIARAMLPRRPFAPVLSASARGASELLKDMDDLDEAISLIESGRCGVPVLLKHYSRIGGRFAGFNLDPAFNNAVDGLVVVDLLKTPGRVLARYMGNEEARSFHAHHGVGASAG